MQTSPDSRALHYNRPIAPPTRGPSVCGPPCAPPRSVALAPSSPRPPSPPCSARSRCAAQPPSAPVWTGPDAMQSRAVRGVGRRQLPASAGWRGVCACAPARCPARLCASPPARPCRWLAAAVSRPPGAPSRARWRSPAWASAPRAGPLERDGSPRARTRQRPSSAPCLPPRPRAPFPAPLCLPFLASRLRAEKLSSVYQRPSRVGPGPQRKLQDHRLCAGCSARGAFPGPASSADVAVRNSSGALRSLLRHPRCRIGEEGRAMCARSVAALALASFAAFAAEEGNVKTWTFEADKIDEPPAGFSFGKTGQGRPGKWVVRAEPGAPAGGRVLAQIDTGGTDNRFPVAVAAEPVLKDLRLEVSCKPVSGKTDQACR